MERDLANHFSMHGWVLVPDVIDAATVALLRQRLAAIYPTFGEYSADPEGFADLADGQFGGLRLWPVDDVELDLMPLEPRLVALARALVGSTELRLLRAGYQAKYAQTADFDQVLHFDYPNHSLVVPADGDIVGFFLYISDVDDDLGPTALVSDTVRGEVVPSRTHLERSAWPTIYEAEQRATGRAGSVLAYRSTTYHRGTAITAEAGVRLTLGYSYGRPAPWNGFMSFPRLGEEPGLRRAVPRMTPEQRQLIGFPGIGDAYWTEDTLRAVAARYPGFDVTPYQRREPRRRRPLLLPGRPP
jgi:ectoine hydroxylase-related dioxygenase (phytanoyl-CoA dioxygenase family)